MFRGRVVCCFGCRNFEGSTCTVVHLSSTLMGPTRHCNCPQVECTSGKNQVAKDRGTTMVYVGEPLPLHLRHLSMLSLWSLMFSQDLLMDSLALMFLPFLFPFLLSLFVCYLCECFLLMLSLECALHVVQSFSSSKWLSTDFILTFPFCIFLILLHVSSNSWFAALKLSNHVYPSLLLHKINGITSLTWMGSEVKTSWQQPRKTK